MTDMTKSKQDHKPTDRPSYNAEAVQKQIEADRRAGRRISKKEAALIHALLRGRS